MDEPEVLPANYRLADPTRPLMDQIPPRCRDHRDYLATVSLLDHLWPDGRLHANVAFSRTDARLEFHRILVDPTWSASEHRLLRAAAGFWNSHDDLGIAEAARTLDRAALGRLLAAASIYQGNNPSLRSRHRPTADHPGFGP